MLGLVLAACAPAALSAEAGSSWWLNADQRGERLLQNGDAAAAARTFTDPRRKAYAALKAGDAAAAASGYSGLDDGDAHYNRGNALVQAGDLKGALDAYDRALARDPSNQDAKHNRELVQAAMKQQNDAPGQDNQDGKRNQQKPGDKPPPDQEKQQKGDAGENGDRSNRGEGSKDQPKPGADSPPKDQAAKGNDAADGKQGGPNPPADASGKHDAQASQPQESKPESPDDAAKARRDVAGNLDRQPGEPKPAEAAQPAGDGSAQPGKDEAAVTAPPPRTEQQLAEEQWLRRIPDDPGGLLRRKFMIEHMLRNPQNNPP